MCDSGEVNKAKTRATQILGENKALKKMLLKRAKQTALRFVAPEDLAKIEQDKIEKGAA